MVRIYRRSGKANRTVWGSRRIHVASLPRISHESCDSRYIRVKVCEVFDTAI